MDENPVYSPDGKCIYIDSVRTGTAQIWRMLADGTDAEQITTDDFANWLPHVCRTLSYVSYQLVP